MSERRLRIREPARSCVAWLMLAALLFLVCSCVSPASERSDSSTATPSTLAASPSGRVADSASQETKPAAGIRAASAQRIEFRQLTLEDGLSQSTINCIVQDSRGFMWFGTQDGLNRYDGYQFRVYEHKPDAPHSLSTNWVQYCYRDPQERLWFVTYDSVLHRYDEAMDRFDRYPLDVEDPYRQAGANIRTLLTDRSGRLWIGTYGGGLVQYDPVADRLVYYRDDLDDPAAESPHDNKVYTIFEDSAGTLWFGTGEGLLRYDEPNNAFVRYPYRIDASEPPDPYKLRSQFVTNLYEDREGRFWVGTTFGGLHQMDRETGRFTAYPYSVDDPNTFSGNTVRSLLEDTDGKLWVSSAEYSSDGTFERLGLERFDPETGKIVRIPVDPDDPCSLSHSAVLRMYEDQQGTLWFHTFAGGVDLYDRETGCFTQYLHDPENPRTLSGDTITVLYEDDSGGMWLGTAAGGISYYHPTWTRFPRYSLGAGSAERLSNNHVLRLYAPSSAIDAEGHAPTLWVSTAAGLNRWDRRAGTFTFYQIDPQLPDIITYALYEDTAGTLWLGTDIGLYRAVPAAGDKMDYTLVLPRTAPQVGMVTAILPDREGRDLWLGLYRIGLARFAPNAGEVVRTYEPDPSDPNSLSDSVIEGVFAGQDGALWIATSAGLDRFDPATETFVHFQHTPDDLQSLSDARILWVYESEGNILWAGTNGDGLQRLDPATGIWTHYREGDGLPNDVVYAVLPQQDAGEDVALWLSTNNGLSRFDLQTESFRNYTYLDGLQSNEFNWQSAYLAPDGEMFFGGVDGVNAFYPDRMWNDPYAPPVYVTGLLLANRPAAVGPDAVLQRSIEVAESARLSYRDRVVSFEFAALYYAMPGRVQYAYMLEGFDGDWIDAGDRRFVTYTNLPPRGYVFRVKAANADGVWNDEGAALSITVTPPVWATWWFRAVAAVLVVGAVAIGYRLRVRSVEARARALERQVAGRTGELSALNAIAGVVSASLDLDEILNGALEKTLDVTGSEAGGIYLLNATEHADRAQGDTLRLAAHRGLDASLLDAIDDLAVGEGFSGHVVETGKPLFVADLSADGRLTRTAVTDQGYRSVAIAPLISRGRVLGSLFIMTSRVMEQTEQDLELLSSIAGQVAVAVDNARLYTDTERRLAQITALQKTSTAVASTLEIDELLHQITEQAAALLEADGGILNLVDWERNEDEAVACVGSAVAGTGSRKPLDSGLSGWIALNNKPAIVSDPKVDERVDREGLESLEEASATTVQNAAGVPLAIKGQVIGSLVLIDKHKGRGTFDLNDLDLLVAFANEAAVAIQNARLFAAEQRRAEQFRVISEVGSHVASILTVDGLLEQMARLIQDAFDYYLVEIGLVEAPDLVFKTRATRDGEGPFETFHLPVDEASITGWVAATGQSLLVPDVSQEKRYVKVTGTKTRSEMAVVMKAQDKIVGVINVESDRLDDFDESDLTVLQSLAHQAAVAIENARLYEQAQQLAVMEERQRLARELHDAVTQTLFSASLISEAVPDLWETDPQEGRALLAELRQLSRGALAEMRTLLLELRPAALIEANLRDLLRQLGEAVAGRVGVPVTVGVDDFGPLPGDVHVALYRIAQEALNNVVKHARAGQVTVSLRCLDNDDADSDPIRIELAIVDNGRGFDPARVPAERLGLGIIRERAQAIDADLEIESGPGQGTRITVVWKWNRL
jgi:signal transduction histidine kinase/ligand-binding sensor domain-containing protein